MDERMDERRCGHEANSLLSWYLNGSLAEDEEAAVKAHVASCEVCAEELDQLAEVAEGLSELQDPLEDRAGDPQRTPARPAANPRFAARPARRRWTYAAAALLLSAALGLYWVYLGLPGLGGGRMTGVLLDLGTGPSRDLSGPPSLALDPAVEAVTFSLVLPSGVGPFTLELRDAEGRALATHAEPPARDPMGRVLYTVPASLLGPGEHALVVRERAGDPPTRSERTFSYPFIVAREDPQRQSPAATKAPQ